MKTKKQHYVFAVSNRSGKIKSVVVSDMDLWSAFERLFQREGVQLTSRDRVFLPSETLDVLSDISVLCRPTILALKHGRKAVLVSRKAVETKKKETRPITVAVKHPKCVGSQFCDECGLPKADCCYHKIASSC